MLVYFYGAKQQLFRYVEKSKMWVLLSNFNEKTLFFSIITVLY